MDRSVLDPLLRYRGFHGEYTPYVYCSGHHRLLHGPERVLVRSSGHVHFAHTMKLTTHYCGSIIQRAGVLPMSIAGIAKEVSTITISAWFFGDELTPVNITGVGITVCGRSSFSV